MQFLYHLKDTLEKQVENEQGRDLIFKHLAIENANIDCQTVLRALKKSYYK